MSPEIRSFYQHIGLSEPKVRFIANGVSVNSECPRDKNELRALLSEKYPNLRPFYERIWVLALARIDQIKGQTSLAGVWTKLPHDVQDRCILVFVGPETTPGELDRLRDAAGELLDRSVIVTGEGGDPWIWMHASDMYISASQFEGMPLAPLEALAAGLPLLLSDICGHHFLSDVAQLFPIQEVGRTTEIIANAIADYTVLNKAEIRERNIEWVSGRYGLANSCRAYEQVYRGKSGVGIE
jgi:glycosyltransferase involved in cell wall biosynthesis